MYYMDDPHTSQVLLHPKVGLHYHPGMVLANDIDEGIVVEHPIGSVCILLLFVLYCFVFHFVFILNLTDTMYSKTNVERS